MNATKEQMKQAQENLRETTRSFKETVTCSNPILSIDLFLQIDSMQAAALQTDEAQRRQMDELIKEQIEKDKVSDRIMELSIRCV